MAVTRSVVQLKWGGTPSPIPRKMQKSILRAICFIIFFECSFLLGFSQVSDNRSSLTISGSAPAGQPAVRMAATNASYPIDECVTYTFRLLIGNATTDNHINELIANYTESSYQVGYTTINGNQQDGLLQKLDMNGQVIWSRTLGRSTLNERIQSVKQLPDGSLVMTGTIENLNGTKQHPFVAKADENGVLYWMKSIQTATDYRGARILASSDGTIGMVAEDDATLIYGQFDAGGNLAWLKQVQLFTKSKAIGIGEKTNWFIAYTDEEAGRKVGGVMVIDPINGNIVKTKKFGGAAVNADFIFHSMQMVFGRVCITGIYSVANASYQLFKIYGNEIGDFEIVSRVQVFYTPGITIDATATIASSSSGEGIAFTNSNTSNDLYVIKSYGFEESSTSIRWTKKFSNIGSWSLSCIERMPDAGYLVVNNGKTTVAPFSPVLALKTDSAGLSSRGCEGTGFNIVKTSIINYFSLNINLSPVALSYTAQTESYSILRSSIDTSFICKELNCPPKPVEDTCAVTFFREFRSTHFWEMSNALSINGNNEVLVTGYMRNDPLRPATDNGILVSFDASGKLAARKKLRLGDATHLGKQYQTADGNVLVLGNSTYNGKEYFTLSKITPALTMIWNKSFEVITPNAIQWQVLESKDGSIFIWYMEGGNSLTKSRLRLVKLDGAGNLIWARGYEPANMNYGAEASACQDDEFIYTANQSIIGPWYTLVMKIEKATGRVIWSNLYMGPGNQTNLYRHIQLWQNSLLITGEVYSDANSTTALVAIEKDGKIKSINAFNYNNLHISAVPLVCRNNDILLSGFVYDNIFPVYQGFISFLRLDANMKVIQSKRIYNGKLSLSQSISEGADGGVYETGWFLYSSVYTTDFYLKKYSADGTMGNCISENVAYNRSAINITASPVNVPSMSTTVSFTTLPFTESDYSLQQNNVVCSSPAICIKPSITGPQQICNGQNVIEYRTQRNSGCTAPVSWITDPAQVKVISTSDSLLKVQFTSNGKTWIKAGVFSGCRWLQDSLEVMAKVDNLALDLGQDTGLCTNTTLAINAHKGFATYTWHDGSVDSLFIVDKPGKYYVTTTDGCGGQYSDTINVAAPIAPVNLGNDTSFCAGYTFVINAGGSYVQYNWSTGAGSASIPVTATGNYSIITTDANSCLSYDTVQVNVFENPNINLPKDSLLCYGNNIKYDAGAGYAKYLWQDGSTNAQYVATGPGKYWVAVINQNNCTGSDTNVITRMVLPPSVFLPADTFLCSYAKIELKPKQVFSQYLWNNAAVTPSITVQQGGLYWLQVTDKYNCTGRDSVLLTSKQCLTGLYVPNAFTPHKDGRNDYFKPIVMGEVVKFEFTIYNRWGQQVFQTQNRQIGWDGALDGKPQGNDTYIWTCTYQFENESVAFRKGTVTLVR